MSACVYVLSVSCGTGTTDSTSCLIRVVRVQLRSSGQAGTTLDSGALSLAFIFSFF